ncbi:hypothetical protein SCLCIDRAFT_614622 [Scleroderma citrinum Foug A]|uniref:Uncharacterized protein n=1 Tax=Scleroderma citrinum Foug A TaxID=1036808 RepID=A0A0C3AIG7_9AGAM|nr:hypothetical protein SCLCIDRAFT_614622 [Scleroderma citrinum Foug A]
MNSYSPRIRQSNITPFLHSNYLKHELCGACIYKLHLLPPYTALVLLRPRGLKKEKKFKRSILPWHSSDPVDQS